MTSAEEKIAPLLKSHIDPSEILLTAKPGITKDMGQEVNFEVGRWLTDRFSHKKCFI
jgi:hypothetical protein